MLLGHLGNAVQIVEYAHAAVVAQIKPCTFLDSGLTAEVTQAQCFLAARVFQHRLLPGQPRVDFSQRPGVLLQESFGDTPVALQHIFHVLLLLSAYVHQQHRPGGALVVGVDYGVEEGVVGFSVGFTAEAAVAAHYQHYGKHCHQTHYP